MTLTKKWTVGQFMTVQPCTVAADLGLGDALDRMEANNIRHLLVTRDNRLVGVISTRDITFAQSLPGIKAKKLHVADAMTSKVYTCQADAAVEDVAAEMEDHRYGCAAVLDDEFVIGIFTTTDGMRAIRSIVRGEKVAPRTIPTHLVDVTHERERVKHHVRIGGNLMSAQTKGPPPLGRVL